MADRLVTIARFNDSIEAEMAKQLLDDFGIRSIVTGQNAANIYTLPTIAAAELQVFQSQSERALEILKSAKEQEQ